MRDVCERVRFSRAAVYRLIAEGRFPAPHKFGPSKSSAVRWRQSDLDRWLANLPDQGEQVAA